MARSSPASPEPPRQQGRQGPGRTTSRPTVSISAGAKFTSMDRTTNTTSSRRGPGWSVSSEPRIAGFNVHAQVPKAGTYKLSARSTTADDKDGQLKVDRGRDRAGPRSAHPCALDPDPQLAAVDRGRLAPPPHRRRRPRSRASRRRRSPRGRGRPSSSASSPPSVSAIRSETSRPASLARVLDRVDDLAGEALAAQLVVELERQRDRAAGLGLDLVALERLHRQRHVVGLERVIVAVDVDADPALAARSPRRRGRDRAPRSRRRPAASCLPKRGPSVR